MSGFFKWLSGEAAKPKPGRAVLRTGTVNRQAIARELHNAGVVSSQRHGQRVIDEYHKLLTRHLDRGRQIRLSGWGIYETRQLPAETRNAFGETVEVPAREYPYFRSSGKLKRLIGRPGVDT